MSNGSGGIAFWATHAEAALLQTVASEAEQVHHRITLNGCIRKGYVREVNGGGAYCLTPVGEALYDVLAHAGVVSGNR